MSGISAEILDAILSPDPSARRNAEAHYHTLAPSDRIMGLLSFLLRPSTPADAGRRMLSATLLRREVSRVDSNDAAAAAVLPTILPHLLDVFFSDDDTTVVGMIGHSIAEVCLSLSLKSDARSDDVNNTAPGAAAMTEVLTRIRDSCTSGANADALKWSSSRGVRLLGRVAARAPVSFVSVLGNDADATRALGFLPPTFGRLCVDYRGMEICAEAACSLASTFSVVQGATAEKNGAAVSELEVSLKMAVDSVSAALEPAKLHSSDGAKSREVQWIAQSLLLPLLGSMDAALSTSHPDESTMIKTLGHFLECMPRCPALFAPANVQQKLVSVLLRLLKQDQQSAAHGHELAIVALETLSTLCSCTDLRSNRAVVTIMLQPEFGVLQGIVQLLHSTLRQNFDLESWAAEPPSAARMDASADNDDMEDGEISELEGLLSTFVDLLGRENSLRVLFPMVQTLLQQSEWEGVVVGLSTLQTCHDVCPVGFSQYLTDALNAGVQFASSENMRVRYQAVQLLGSLCSSGIAEHEEVIAASTPQVLQALCGALSTTQNCLKVVSHACLALISYCRGADASDGEGGDRAEVLLPHVGQILQSLQAGPLAPLATGDFSMANPVVLLRGVYVLACIADCTKEAFRPYFQPSVGILTSAIQMNGVGEDCCMVRGAALEALTIVCGAVTPDDDGEDGDGDGEGAKVAADAMATIVLPLLQQAAAGGASPIPLDQVLASSARFASGALRGGEKFVPFAGPVMQQLLGVATLEVNLSVTDADESGLAVGGASSTAVQRDGDRGTESVTVSLPGIVGGDKTITLNTTQMQEKAQAARATYEIASAMGTFFEPYVEASAAAFLPLVAFKYSAEVRFTASQALAAIFESSCECASAESGPNAQVSQLPRQLFPPIVSAIAGQLRVEDVADDDLEACLALAESLSDSCYEAFHHKCAALSVQQADELCGGLVEVIGRCLERRAGLLRAIASADEDDAADIEGTLSSETDLLTSLVDSIGYTLKSLREAFVPIFDRRVAPAFQPLLLGTSDDVRARVAAVCLFDDCVEYGGADAAARYAPQLLQGAMLGMASGGEDGDVLDLKTASVYGVAQIVRHAPPEVLAPHAGALIVELQRIVGEGLAERQSQQGNEEESFSGQGLMENAVSALASMVLFRAAPFADVAGANKTVILNMFLQSMPLRMDDSEAQVCMNGLCDMIEAGLVDVTKHASDLMRTMGETLQLVSTGEEVATPDTCSRFGGILSKMQEKVDGSVMQRAFDAMSPEDQLALQGAAGENAASRGVRVVSP